MKNDHAGAGRGRDARAEMTINATPAGPAAGEAASAGSAGSWGSALAVEYASAEPVAGERAAYDVAIGGRVAARLACVDRRWRLEYAGHAFTLASPAAATSLVERYADRIREGRPLDVYEPSDRRQKHSVAE